MSQDMKVIEATEFALEGLQESRRPIPTAGPGEILVKVKAASLNYRDIAVMSGTYLPGLQLPYVPVSDCAGAVVAVGDGVTRFATGDRVIPCYIQGWQNGDLTQKQRKEQTLGAPLDGVLQEYIVVPAENAVPTPAILTDEEAATLPIAALTAWHCLQSGGVAPGKKVLVQGSGGVALFALQFAKALGATVVALTSSSGKADFLTGLGADHVINYRDVPEWAGAVREATGGTGVDIIVETTGTSMPQSLNACAFGGFIGVIGFVGGYETSLDIRQLIGPKIRLEGIVVGSRAMMEDMIQAIEQHALHPVIAERFSWLSIVDAFDALKAGDKPGKIVLQVA
ncbi:Alcohol dehydrogenase [Defluviimonas aquaemixtae]|uniref:Alcohol dehydrogenase n=1 Tax=Albidovulum aquaemixtae TaxID=1542388 RepID=A0A2R8BKW8_9RHOB|nr:NAD(P)-dependent alcohol dehydrogenase [Defluviimonas aquaemixtae]SPH23963.1 Alcohol dehydrogenase [Defluviimonas aquaemixtae]